jgi:hypothetical protein
MLAQLRGTYRRGSQIRREEDHLVSAKDVLEDLCPMLHESVNLAVGSETILKSVRLPPWPTAVEVRR